MPGVTHVQVRAELYFDDGYIIVISSPIFKKEIRTGIYFSDAQVQQILTAVGNELAQIVDKEKLSGLHNNYLKASNEHNSDRRKPRWDDLFSLN